MPSPPGRRRLQFSLGTLFVFVTVFAVWLGWELKFIRERNSFLALLDDCRTAEIEAARGRFVFSWILTPAYEDPVIPVWRRWLGDQAQGVIILPGNTTDAHLQTARELFPEAKYFGKDGVAIPNE
jgi:hypothetical protein